MAGGLATFVLEPAFVLSLFVGAFHTCIYIFVRGNLGFHIPVLLVGGVNPKPMVQALGDEFIAKYVLPYTQLRRLIRPDEIADAICFMISNSAVSGELWADAGWHPPA